MSDKTLDEFEHNDDEQSFDDLSVEDKILALVDDGATTINEVVDRVEFSRSYMGRTMRQLAEEGRLDRTKNGNSYVYSVALSETEAPDTDDTPEKAEPDNVTQDAAVAGPSPAPSDESTSDSGGLMPVDRDYDWDKRVLADHEVDEYIETNGEMADVKAMIRTREETGMLPHFAISGETGTAKTTFAENIAHAMSAPLFTVQCGDGLRVSELLGSPTLVDDESWWTDGTVTQALIASKERPVVLLIDEVNRAPARSKALLFSVLDGRCQVSLDGRGGELVTGDPMNLIVISTMNKGPNYSVNNIDDAEKRRLGPEWQITHLGLEDKQREIDLIADRTPACHSLAEKLVDVANTIRQRAAQDGPISFGTSTGLVLDWARTAHGLKHRDNPVVAAAQRVFTNPYHGKSDEEEGAVSELVNKHLDGCPVGEEAVREWAGEDVSDTDDPEGMLDCTACGYYEDWDEAGAEIQSSMKCPNCDDEDLQLHS